MLFQVLGLFPDIGSKFVVVYGIEAFLDPFLIGIVDCILLVKKFIIVVIILLSQW